MIFFRFIYMVLLFVPRYSMMLSLSVADDMINTSCMHMGLKCGLQLVLARRVLMNMQ
jgi:hypothetical protein